MKDFEKTNSFINDMNAFSRLLLELWHNQRQSVEPYLSRLRKLKDRTRLVGDQLIEEVKEVCQDMKDLQYYFDLWCRRLDQIDTSFICMDEISSSDFAYKFQDDQAALALYGIIKNMAENYNDAISNRDKFAMDYGLETEDSSALKEFVEEKKKMIQEESTDTDTEKISNSRKKVIKADKDIFSRLINTNFNKEKVLEWLHQNIDGQRPKDIGLVIAYAVRESLLRREPKEKEFRAEFNVKGNWTGIWKYFHIYDEPTDNEKEEHDRIINDSIPEYLKYPFET